MPHGGVSYFNNNKGNAKRGVSPRLKILPGVLHLRLMTLKIIRVPHYLKDYVCTKFGQNPLKNVDSRVFTRMLRKDGRKDRRTDGSVTISLRNFVGEGIIT
jgi:hypothetical protein